MPGRAFVVSCAITMLASCASPAATELPEDWDRDVRLAPAVDLDPDPATIEIELVARPADVSIVPVAPTAMWTYGGTVPGPFIDAHVGDRLVVHFRNELPEPTTVHWHGVRVPNEMDGSPGHPSPAVPPGGTFEYDFVLPDEGLYWFHPHVRSAAQVAAGMAGVIRVRADDEPELDELVLALSDVSVDPMTGILRPPDSGGDLATLFGRDGDVIVVNGRSQPVITVRNGVPIRLRLVNTAISRYFQLAMTDHRFHVIGGDRGIDATTRDTWRLLVLPGQRVDVIFTPHGDDGERIPLRWVPYDRGYGSFEYREEQEVLSFALLGPDARVGLPPIPARTFEPLVLSGATQVSIDLTRGTEDGHVVLGIDGIPSWRAEPFVATVGETQVWTIHNTTEWAHPIHLHGFFFQPLDDHLGATGVWADTIDVGEMLTARFAVRYDDRPGMWMLHCHILDHADAGMMGMIDVLPDPGASHTH